MAHSYNPVQALLMAAAQGNTTQVKDLLNIKGLSVSVKGLYKNVQGVTALMVAADHGQGSMCEYLLRQPAANAPEVALLHCKNEKGWDAMSYAAGAGHHHVCKILLKYKPNMEARDNDGITALGWAASNTNAKRRAVETCDFLCKRRANVNAKDNRGNAPLLQAAVSEYPDLAKTLLRHGANVNAMDNEGATPIIAAVSIGDLEMIKLFIQAGATLRSSKGHRTVFDTACFYRDTFRGCAQRADKHQQVVDYLQQVIVPQAPAEPEALAGIEDLAAAQVMVGNLQAAPSVPVAVVQQAAAARQALEVDETGEAYQNNEGHDAQHMMEVCL